MILKTILAFLLLTVEPADIELKAPIEWQLTVKVTNELTIKSYYVNHDAEDIDRVILYYARSMDKFTEFRDVSCEVKPLEIRIINEEQMNSSEFFTYIRPTIYGRYFRENQHMYLTIEATKNRKYFAHEMAHYLFDICKINFDNADDEHKEVKRFLKYLDEK